MFSLFSLLFKNNYWRMLLRKGTWSEAWLSLTRVHKDRRARRHLLGVGLLALIPLACLLYLAWLIGSGAWLFVPLVAPILWWQNRRAKEDDKPMHITPRAEPVVRALTAKEQGALRRYFAEMTLVYAVLVDRVGSESFLKEKELPEGVEVASRRVHLDLLKAHGLWERMTREDREAMMMPDGHWDWALIQRVALGMETLRLLRWILQIDFYLPAVGQQMKGDFGMAHELVVTPEKALKGKALVDVGSMETGQEAAQVYFGRCLAEAISRGYYEAGDEESSRWAKGVSQGFAGDQHEDLLLGNKLVSESTKEDLLWAMSLSRRREAFLGWALSVVTMGKELERAFPGVSSV